MIHISLYLSSFLDEAKYVLLKVLNNSKLEFLHLLLNLILELESHHLQNKTKKCIVALIGSWIYMLNVHI